LTLTAVQRVLLFSALLGALALAGVISEVGWRAPGPSLGVSWPVVALGFGASTLLCVHLEFRRDALTYTLSEVPLIIGLIALPPVQVPLALLLGGGVALMLQRRRWVKFGYNLASHTLEAAAAAAVYHAVLGHSSPLGAVGWMAAAAAAATINAISIVTVPVVVGLYSGRLDPALWRSSAIAGGLCLVANTSLALIAATVLAENRWAVALLVVVAAVLYLLARAQASLRQRYASLQVLYDFTRKVGASGGGDVMVTTILDEARSVLRAEVAELLLFGSGPTRPMRTVLSDGDGSRTVHLDGESVVTLETSALATGTALVISRNDGSDEQRAELARRGYRDVMVAPLHIDAGYAATLLVANRLGDVSSFDAEDGRVFQALVNHASVALENSRLIDQLRQESLQKEHQALHDPLTGLPNRTLFHREIDNAIAAPRDASSLVAVMLMDLDRFKEVNDTLGHHLGDVLLEAIGARLTAALGDRGLVGRLGGDEFGILLRAVPDTTTARAVATDLCNTLKRPFPLGDLFLEVGASIGIALAPNDGDGGTVLLQRADVAMYAAKRDGDNIEFYLADKDRNSPRRLSLLGELRHGIDQGELVVYYQPKADLRTGAIVGAEALVRWNHPQYGLLLPAEFIPIAEHSGLMAPLTRQVLEVAMTECHQWLQSGISLGVAVNLPVRSLLDTGLPAEIQRILDYAGVGPEHLSLEITEGTLMVDPPRAIAVLQRLAELGVTLSIDDFGTGYSSLAYLQRLPVSELKIDRCFVANLTSDTNDAAIVRSTTELGHNLGLSVVAEGVEDWETWRRLLANDVDIAQGYILSRPVPAPEFVAWVTRWQPDEVPGLIAAGPERPATRPRLASVAGGPGRPSRRQGVSLQSRRGLAL